MQQGESGGTRQNGSPTYNSRYHKVKQHLLTLWFLLMISHSFLSAQTVNDSVQMLRQVNVSAMALRNVKSTEMGHVNLSGEAIIHLPSLFGEADIVKALQTLPGVTQGVEGFSGLYVHGGEGDENIFLYQGMPLYHVGHLGGIFSAFNANTIDNVDFYKAAFPARYGGFASSVVDIRMKQPDFEKAYGSLSVGLLTSQLSFTCPVVKDKVGIFVAVRRSLVDLFAMPVLAIINHSKKKDGEKYLDNYSFEDANVRIDWKASPTLRISLVGYEGHDRFKIGERDFNAQSEAYTLINGKLVPDNPEDVTSYFDETTNRLSWGNLGAALNTSLYIGDSQLSLLTSVTHYASHYTQRHEAQSDLNDGDTYTYNLSGTRNAITDLTAKLTFNAPVTSFYHLETGLSAVEHHFLPEDIEKSARQGSQPINEQNNSKETINIGELSAFADNNLSPTQWLAVNIGARLCDYIGKNKSYLVFEPRIASRILMTSNMSIKVSYTRMHQAAQQLSTNYVSLPTDLWLPTVAVTKPLSCNQITAGIFANLPHNTWVSVEGWYKDLQHLMEYKEGITVLNPDMTWSEKTTEGKGWCYGVDTSVRHQGKHYEANIGYSLLWNYRKYAELNRGRVFPAKFDNRHKIDLVLTYHHNEDIDFTASWTYMTGNRVTLAIYNYDLYGSTAFPDAPQPTKPFLEETGIGYISARNNYRIPAFQRLNIGMTLRKMRRSGKKSEWNFSLYNAYWHNNAIAIKKDDDNGVLFTNKEDWHRDFKALSLIPIIPSISYTYDF